MKIFSLAVAILLMGSVFCSAITIEFFVHGDFVNATNNINLVNFDNRSQGVINGTEFQPQGLTIVNRDGLNINVTPAFQAQNLNSAPNGISASSSPSGGFTNSFGDNFDFILTEASNSAGLFIGNVGPANTTIQFLDAGGGLIASEVLTASHEGIIVTNGFNNRIFYGITTDQAIKTIRTFQGINDSDGIVFDDVQFGDTATSVPEPSTLVCLLGALALLGQRVRK